MGRQILARLWAHKIFGLKAITIGFDLGLNDNCANTCLWVFKNGAGFYHGLLSLVRGFNVTKLV